MKKKTIKKTNAMRILDTRHIPYEVLVYEWIEGRHTGVHAAEELGLDEASVFKTLVGQGTQTGPVVFCIPVAKELDLKQAARVSGNKAVHLIAVKELLELTGYMRGGCSPVGMKKSFPTYFDISMRTFEKVSVSGGLRGVQLRLAPQDLAMAVQAEMVPLTMEEL